MYAYQLGGAWNSPELDTSQAATNDAAIEVPLNPVLSKPAGCPELGAGPTGEVPCWGRSARNGLAPAVALDWVERHPWLCLVLAAAGVLAVNRRSGRR